MVTSDFPGDLQAFFSCDERRHAKPRYRRNVRRGCMCMARTHAHVSTDDDGKDKDTRHLRYNSCNVATDVCGRGRGAGKTGARACVAAGIHVRVVYTRKGWLPPPLPRASLIHFHYIFAIGALRRIPRLTFNRASHVSRCNFAGSFFFSFRLFFSQLLSRLVSRGHLRAPARLLCPADDSTSSLQLAAFVFTDDFFSCK